MSRRCRTRYILALTVFRPDYKYLRLIEIGWLRGTVVERRSVTGELSLSYARPAADG